MTGEFRSDRLWPLGRQDVSACHSTLSTILSFGDFLVDSKSTALQSFFNPGNFPEPSSCVLENNTEF